MRHVWAAQAALVGLSLRPRPWHRGGGEGRASALGAGLAQGGHSAPGPGPGEEGRDSAPTCSPSALIAPLDLTGALRDVGLACRTVSLTQGEPAAPRDTGLVTCHTQSSFPGVCGPSKVPPSHGIPRHPLSHLHATGRPGCLLPATSLPSVPTHQQERPSLWHWMVLRRRDIGVDT